MSRGSSSTPNYNDLLKKTEHYDKDERYMAISDLCEALKRNAAQANSAEQQGGGGGASSSGGGSNNNLGSHSASSSFSSQIDSQTERRICSAVLSLLDDSSNDVQTVAVKTLSVLLKTVQEEQVVEIADRLCTLVLDQSKSDLRDVYAIGLKTLVETVPKLMGNIVSHRLISRLIEGIHTNSTNNTKRVGGKSSGGSGGNGNGSSSSSSEDKSSLIESLSNSTPAAANTNDPIDSLSSSLKSIYTTMCMFDSLTLPYTSTMPITKSKSLSSPQVKRQRSRVRRGHQATMVIVPTKCHDGRTVQRASPAA